MEQMLAIEDLMYICILEKFQVGAGALLVAGKHRALAPSSSPAAAHVGAALPGHCCGTQPVDGCVSGPSLTALPSLGPHCPFPCQHLQAPAYTHTLPAPAGDWRGHAAAGGAD